MRKEIYRLERRAAVALLARAPVVHVAATGSDGGPLLRTVHAVVLDDALYFHGAPAGEKTEALGRPGVVAAEEVVAPIPSYFVDPERACPATTYYRSVQVHAALEEALDPMEKARALDALMDKYQPEGGCVPIAADHPLYRKAIAGLLVVRVPLTRVDGKAKLGQNRSPEERARLLERLWARGLPGDPRAIELIRDANPGTPTPTFLAAPDGARLVCALDPADLPAVVELLAGAYWNQGTPRERIAAAHLGATAWVGARDGSGAPIASARALSDGAKCAWLYDVVVAPAWRGHGLGAALVRLLLDHPAVRGSQTVLLGTRDAQRLYARFGFVERAALSPRPYAVTEMALVRPARDPTAATTPAPC